jgi:hypothetical protein
MRRLCREPNMPLSLSDSRTGAPPRNVLSLRHELAQAERVLRERAASEAVRLAEAESVAWREAQDMCFAFDRIRERVKARLQAINAGDRERFPCERKWAEMALHDAHLADASYTLISFARLRDRLRYLRGGADRETVVREALKRGGVHTERGYFQEILK